MVSSVAREILVVELFEELREYGPVLFKFAVQKVPNVRSAAGSEVINKCLDEYSCRIDD